MHCALPTASLFGMDKHTVFSLLIAFWPVWVGLFVSLVVLRFEDGPK